MSIHIYIYKYMYIYIYIHVCLCVCVLIHAWVAVPKFCLNIKRDLRIQCGHTGSWKHLVCMVWFGLVCFALVCFDVFRQHAFTILQFRFCCVSALKSKRGNKPFLPITSQMVPYLFRLPWKKLWQNDLILWVVHGDFVWMRWKTLMTSRGG